jgi:hypothetical protein
LDAADASTLTLSGSNVTQWNDKSGSGYVATQFRGASGNQPTLVNNSVYINNNSNSAYNSSTYTCLKFNNNPITSAQTTLFAVFKVVSTVTYDALVQITYGNLDQFRIFGQNTAIETWGGNNGPVRTNNSTFSINTQLLTSWVSQTSSSQVFLNGTSLALNNTSAALDSPSAGVLNIGGGKSDGRWFTGYVSEIIWYNAVLTTNQRQQVEGYLASKWGLKGSLPSTHPFKRITP